MAKFFIFLEHADGQIKRGGLELLSAAKNAGGEISIFTNNEAIAEQAAKYGATTGYVCKNSTLENYNPEAYCSVVSEAISKSGASVVLASSSMLARDLFPRVAAKMNVGFASDCTEIKFNGDNLLVRKPLYAGKCSATVQFSNSNIKIVLMRANQLPISQTGNGSIKIENLSFSKPDLKTVVKEVVRGTSKKLDLTEANIIVSGGRGLKEAKNFELLNPLAEVLGATVGASRAVVDAGWVPHGMQVGQTGKTVAPSLYIACGISGAIQHLAGMSGSKVIVAINSDASAPIFQKATYGIVGDVFEIVPKLTEEFRKALS
ncbi:MAG: electron transfer flavoprotein subunit alpha [Proteobacteria bacterium SG_bin7]|nr:MAG: electron transfer flavoprotein subunit alpha [Proteobacteria bacterium SG_bin7]